MLQKSKENTKTPGQNTPRSSEKHSPRLSPTKTPGEAWFSPKRQHDSPSKEKTKKIKSFPQSTCSEGVNFLRIFLIIIIFPKFPKNIYIHNTREDTLLRERYIYPLLH